MKKKHSQKTVKIISGKDLLINSGNKLGKHMPEVRTGTGQHKNKKAYDRKQNKKVILKGYKDGYPSKNDFF